MSPSDLREVWAAVARPPVGRLNGRRIREAPAWAALDSAGRWHLLIRITAGEQGVVAAPTRGLSVTTEEMQVADEPVARHIDLACMDAAFGDAFLALSAEVVQALAVAADAASADVLRVLERWRRFWSVSQAGLSEEAALGLFGELWFLERWLVLPGAVRRWRGPEGARHDFQWDEFSVEVKTSRSAADGLPVHRIVSIDQLADPERGRLHLFSLHVTRDVLAAHTLPSMVGRVEAALAAHPSELSLFRERLARVGWSPAHAGRHENHWRILHERLYAVEGAFPRLTMANFVGGLPAGVGAVSYSIDLAAAAPWCVADRPTAPAAAFLRS